MGRRGVLVASLAALALAVGGYFLFRPTDESRIRDKVAKLAAAVRVTEADMQANPIGRLAHVSGVFQTLFEPDVRVSVPGLPQLRSGREQLEQAMTAAPRFVRTFDVSIDVNSVKLDEGHTSAEVSGVAEATALDRNGDKRHDKRVVSLQFVKVDGEWLISTLDVWSKEDAPSL